MVELLKVDSDWVKTGYDNSLYIRPFVIASEASISASEADEYSFMIICTLDKAYYQNQEIWVKLKKNLVELQKVVSVMLKHLETMLHSFILQKSPEMKDINK